MIPDDCEEDDLGEYNIRENDFRKDIFGENDSKEHAWEADDFRPKQRFSTSVRF